MSSKSNANGVQHGEWAGEVKVERASGQWGVGGTAAVEPDDDVGDRGQGGCLALGSSSWRTKGEECPRLGDKCRMGLRPACRPNVVTLDGGGIIPPDSRLVRIPIRPVVPGHGPQPRGPCRWPVSRPVSGPGPKSVLALEISDEDPPKNWDRSKTGEFGHFQLDTWQDFTNTLLIF
jgi:hypothetical protein